MDFKYEIRREENKVYLEIEIPSAEVDRRLDEKLEEIRRNTQVPGFRVGRAPKAVVEMYYGKTMATWVKMDLLKEASSEALEKCDIIPISAPNLETPKDLVRGHPFVFRVSIDVLPDAKLGDYRSIVLDPVPLREITEKDIDSWIEEQRRKRAVLEPIMDRDVVQAGDFVMVSYEVFVDGEWKEDLSAEREVIRVEEGDPIFSPALIGTHVGETKRIKVPEGKSFKGIPPERDVEIVVAVDGLFSEIKVNDEELLKEFGCENMDQLREKAREDLESLARMERRNAMKAQILTKLMEISEVDLPDHLIERRMEVLSLLGLPEEERRKFAELYEKERAVLATLAKAEGISVTEEEIEMEMERMKSEEEDILESRREIRERLRKEKVLNHLLDILGQDMEG